MLRKQFAAILLLVCLVVPTLGMTEELLVSGVGKAAITPDIALTREESLRNAKREAIIAAINQINGPNSFMDPKIQAAADQMVTQLGNELIADQSSSRDAANNFVTRVTLRLDDLVIRQMIQAQGIASTVARNYPIMIVMDEFFTTATDHQKPLRELIEYSSDQTSTFAASHSEASSAASASSSSAQKAYEGSASASYAASGGVDASSSSSARLKADGQGSASARESNSYSAKYDESGAASKNEIASSASRASSSFSSSSNLDEKVFDQQKDVANFRKLVEFQPQNVGPDKQSFTYAALVREAGRYDLNLLDNDLFRSKYFTGKPLTMEEMQNSSELSRYVAAARDSKADYFMVGNAIIIDNGKNESISAYVCDGLVTVKSYSTEDGAVLATDSRSESATGNSPDQCRVNVANKLAGFVGSTLGSTIQNYWRQRETYGREYSVRLISLLGNLSEDDKDAFAEALESIDGLQSKLVERKSTRGEYEVSLTYKGDRSISREIGSALKNVEGFKAVGRKVTGTTINICLEGPCPEI